MRTEFTIPRDGLKLHAVLDRPEGCDETTRGPLTIFMHGFTGNVGCEADNPYEILTQRLLAVGQSVLRFDFNGHGKSEGSFTHMNVLNEICDAATVLEYVRQLPYVTEISLVGHSQGGVVAGMTAGYYADVVKRLVQLAPAAVLKYDAQRGMCFGTQFDTEHIAPVVPVGPEGHPVGGHYFRIAKLLPIYEVTSAYHGPVLIVHGEFDDIVDSKVAGEYQSVLENCAVRLYPELDHGLCGADQAAAFDEVVKFFQ